MCSKFKIGDLVSFDFSHALGTVIDIKKTEDVTGYDHKVYDVLVYWSDGETFWCMDFTLEPVLFDVN